MKQSVPRPSVGTPADNTTGFVPPYGETPKVAGVLSPATHEKGRITGPVNKANETVLDNPGKYTETKEEMHDENGGTGAGQYGTK